MEQRYCSTRDHLDKVLNYLDNALKATIKPAREANIGLSTDDAPMDMERYETKEVNLGNQVSGFDPTFE